MTKLTSTQDVDDFLRGANFLSASGGGDPVEERQRLTADLEEGLSLTWSPISDFDPEALICTSCFSGSIAPEAIERQGKDDFAASVVERPMVAAIEALERELGRPIDGLVSIEIGGDQHRLHPGCSSCHREATGGRRLCGTSDPRTQRHGPQCVRGSCSALGFSR